MDKYEYQVRTDQIKQLISEKRFAEAMDIVDTIDWRRVRSVSMLCMVSEIYKVNKRYEDSRDILLLAYERHPTGRDIIYALCELAIKMGDIVQAIECYKEFCNIAEDDPDSCILLYKIYKAQDVSLEEQIDILEEYKKREYREKWAYELATLYHQTGQAAKCVAECDELVLWFGEGKYVRKAMELKMKHQPLTQDQQAKYDGRATVSQMPTFDQPENNQAVFGNNLRQTGPMMSKYGEYINETGPMESVTGALNQNAMTQGTVNQPYQPYNQNGAYMNQPYANQGYENPTYDQNGNMIRPTLGNPYGDMDQISAGYGYMQPQQQVPMNHLGMTQDIVMQPSADGVWSTMDLQEQLAGQVQEVLSQNNNENAYVYSDNQSIYESAQQNVPYPQLFEDKYINESNLPGEELPETEKSSINKEEQKMPVVGTGVIDLKDANLPPVEKKEESIGEDKFDSSSIPSIEKREIEETSDLYSKLEGVIPDNAPVKPVSVKPSEPVAKVSEEVLNAERTIAELQEKNNEIGANGSVVNGPKTKSSITGSIPDVVLPSKKDSESEDSEKSKDNTVSEKKNVTEIKASTQKGNYPYDTVTDMGEVEELPEIEQPEDVGTLGGTKDFPIEKIKEEKEKSDLENIKEEVKDSSDNSEYEKKKDKNKSEESDDISEKEAYEKDTVEEEEENDLPSYMKDEVIRSEREFDDDEFRLFCRFDGIEMVKAQLTSAMDKMSMDSSNGNVLIMGLDTEERRSIAINIVKTMQSKSGDFTGKLARITGDALNKKNIKATFSKLNGGVIIVQNAGGLTLDTVNSISEALISENMKIIVMFEDDKEAIRPLYKASKKMRQCFDAIIDIQEFTNDDLVAYGRGYALEKEYTIDEMGTLALYNKVGDMQTYDHKVTVAEIKDIIDEAISHVDKKSMSHFMDVLLGQRYDDQDYIILREKDFVS